LGRGFVTIAIAVGLYFFNDMTVFLVQISIEYLTNAIGQGAHAVMPKPSERPPPMPISWRTISCIRSAGATGEAIRKMYEIKRPMASETAAISEPALAVLIKASKGCEPPFH